MRKLKLTDLQVMSQNPVACVSYGTLERCGFAQEDIDALVAAGHLSHLPDRAAFRVGVGAIDLSDVALPAGEPVTLTDLVTYAKMAAMFRPVDGDEP